MKPQTTKERVEMMQELYDKQLLLIAWQDIPAILADLRTLHAEAEREAEIERIAKEHGIYSACDRDGGDIETNGTPVWLLISDGIEARKKLPFGVQFVYPTRRECDDAILAAVRDHEQKESVSK